MRAPARRLWVVVVLGVALLFGYAFLVEPQWIEVTSHRLGSSTGRIRVAQISDLHMRGFGKREARVAHRLREIKPDLVVISGDVIGRTDTLPALKRFLAEISPLPTVAVLGNWEHWSGVDLVALRGAYEEEGDARLLVNQSATFEILGRRVQVVGLDDYAAGRPDADLLRGKGSADSITLLVQHSPGFFDAEDVAVLDRRFTLCLSGHTHGGQITVFGRALWKPPGSGRFAAGWYETAACKLYVSRGIGTSIVAARLGARPEIAVFDL